MKNIEFFKKKKAVYSFEIFPPKKTSPVETVYRTLRQLHMLQPDYISVTYGAGGTEPGNKTCDLAALIRHGYGVSSVAHITCINSTKATVKAVLEELQANHIENLLALRGDRNENASSGEFRYASELIAFIQEHGDFDIAAACYPEGHVESKSLEEDILHLKEKVDAGASHLVTQLFFDNHDFFRFMERCEKVGINVPVQAGIMPVLNINQIKRIVSMCGAKIPAEMSKLFSRYETDPESMRSAGADYAVQQIEELLQSGVAGIHLYTMNNAEAAEKITRQLAPTLARLNGAQA